MPRDRRDYGIKMQDGPGSLVGKTIGARYELRGLLGRGGFADVYRAWDDFNDVEVALKVLKVPGHLSEAAQQEFVARFRDEAKLTRKVFSGIAGVRQVLDMGAAELDGGVRPWMAMELLEGETLHAWLRRRRGAPARLSLAEVLTLLRPVFETVGFAHERGVAHRDLKPANVFLQEPSGGAAGPLVKVLDFGIAKVLEDEAMASGDTMTQSVVQMFSPQYGAPEQFAGKKTGKYTDVFSLGLMVTELLTDRAPLSESGDRAECMAAALDKRQRPTPAALGVAVPQAVEAVLARAVAFKEADRQGDALELLRELESARGIAASPDASSPKDLAEPGGVATSFAERLPTFSATEQAAPAPVAAPAVGATSAEPAPLPPVPRVVAVPLAGRPAWKTPLSVAAGLLVLGGLAAGGAAFHTQQHATPKLCPAGPKMLAQLRAPLQVDAYVTRGTPKLDAFAAEVTRLLEAYKRASNGRFAYRIVEAKDDAARAAAKEAGLLEQTFGEATGSDSQGAILRKGFSGMVLTYGAEKETIKSISPESAEGLEFWLINKVRELRAKADGQSYKLGLVTGHHELAISEPNLVAAASGNPNLKQIIAQNFPFYSFRDVDVSASEVDPELQGLLVTQPASDYTAVELERLDAFLMRGRSLAILVSAANAKAGDPEMGITLSTHGLERLLAGYGITLHKDLLLDADASFSVKAMGKDGTFDLRFPFVPLVKGDALKDPPGLGDRVAALDARSPPFFRLSEVAFPFPSSLDVDPSIQAGARARVLARTSAKTSRLTDATIALAPFTPRAPSPASPTSGPATLAVSLEGSITSAFGRGKTAGSARVLVFSSSQFLANPFARAGNPSGLGAVGGDAGAVKDPNAQAALQLASQYAQTQLTSTILAFKNTLDWMVMDEDLAECALPVGAKKN